MRQTAHVSVFGVMQSEVHSGPCSTKQHKQSETGGEESRTSSVGFVGFGFVGFAGFVGLLPGFCFPSEMVNKATTRTQMHKYNFISSLRKRWLITDV